MSHTITCLHLNTASYEAYECFCGAKKALDKRSKPVYTYKTRGYGMSFIEIMSLLGFVMAILLGLMEILG